MRSTERLAVAWLDVAISLSEHAVSLDDLMSTTLINSNHLPSRTGVERLQGTYIQSSRPCDIDEPVRINTALFVCCQPQTQA